MIHWKRQLHPMLRVFKRSICILVISFVLLLQLTGCAKKKEESMNLGQWIEVLVEKSGLPSAIESKPYFFNISPQVSSFDAVQAAVEWGVLNTDVHFDPEEPLTKEWIAYTLVNLYGVSSSNQKIKDISKTQFPEQVAASISLGLMKLDSRECFNPKDTLPKEEAIILLEKTIQFVNQWEPKEEVSKVEFNSEIGNVQNPMIEFDKEKMIAIFEGQDFKFKVGDLLYLDDAGKEIYKIKAIVQEGSKIEVHLQEPTLDEVVEEVDVETKFNVDFDQVEIETEGQVKEKEVGLFLNDPLFQPLANKEFEIQGFNIQLNASGSTLSATVSKELSSGGVISAEFKVFNVQPTIRWKAKGVTIEEAYFRMDYKTTALLSFHRGKNKHYYSDFSFLEGPNFLKTLKSSFSNELTHTTATIDLATITIPIANVPSMNIRAKLQLFLYANGKIELSLSNAFDMGLEIRNNKMRFFSNQTYNQQFMIRATGGIIGGFTTELRMLAVSLVDLSLQAGIRGKVESTFYLKGEENPLQQTEMEYDFLESAHTQNSKLKTCGEISAHWVLDVLVNTEETFASRLGLRYQKSILNERNASIIPKNLRFIENGHFVSQCFKQKEEIADIQNPTIDSDKLSLNQYNLIVEKGKIKKLKVTKIPKGYTMDDLVISSSNLEVAEVDETLEVRGKTKGAAIITIETKDKAYRVTCNILVTDNRDEEYLP